jgi:hypothetical protein
MKNKITKNLIILGAIIFSFALVSNVSASTSPDCIISNFKVNGLTSIRVPSGNPVTLSWNTINCKSVKLSGHNINTNVALNGYLTINPTVSSSYGILAMSEDYYYQSQTIEVSVIPSSVSVDTPVSTVVNPVIPLTPYDYYPTPSTTVTNTNTTPNTSINKNTTTDSTSGANNLGASANNGITALSLRGSGGFMPSSIWQWLLVIVLILAIIVISRVLIRKPTVAQETHTTHVH